MCLYIGMAKDLSVTDVLGYDGQMFGNGFKKIDS